MSDSATTQRHQPLTVTADGEDLPTLLKRGDIPIAVYGLGKIGLPVATVFAAETNRVIGVDIDETLIDQVATGTPPYEHEPGLKQELTDVIERQALEVTTDGTWAAETAAIHLIIVPVPLSDEKTADFSAFTAAIDTIATGIEPGDLVVVESTVPPGTCETFLTPRLIEKADVDPTTIGVATCPERTSSGRALADVRGSYPRVYGGVTEEATKATGELYSVIVDNELIPVSDATTAEAVKLFEGVYRDVNIALANELAQLFDSGSFAVRDAIEAANTQPYCDIHEPGAGVGGHCIPYYPYFLMEATDVPASLLNTAREVNDSMPTLMVTETLAALASHDIAPQEATVAVLGYCYRPEIPEIAATPAQPLIEQLREQGVTVLPVDPIVDTEQVADTFVSIDDITQDPPDAIVLVTAHGAFKGIPWDDLDIPVIIDGRDALRPDVTPTYTIGRGYSR